MGCGGSSALPPAPNLFNDPALFCAEYQIGEQFTEGSFGKIWVARPTAHGKPDATECLVKIVDQRFWEDALDSRRCAALRKELAIQKQVGSHPNILQMLGWFHKDSRCYVVLERCNGSLLDLMETEPPANEHEVARFFRQMLLGVAHLHSCSVVHRDIQLRNFLLGGPDGKDLQLTDFGHSRKLPAELTEHTIWPRTLTLVSNGPVGAIEYAAPEVLGRKLYGSGVDIWAFGIAAYMLLYGEHPYIPQLKPCDTSPAARKWRSEDVEKAILWGNSPAFRPCSHEQLGWKPSLLAAEFAREVLVHDPNERKSARTCLALPLLSLPSWLAWPLAGDIPGLDPLQKSLKDHNESCCGDTAAEAGDLRVGRRQMATAECVRDIGAMHRAEFQVKWRVEGRNNWAVRM